MKFAHLVDVNDFVNWCDYLGTLAFAVSGIRLAAGKGLDWFGAYVVGFVTAVGGGTIRDILLDIKPFWLVQPSYLIITALGLIFTIIFRRQVVRLNHSLFVFERHRPRTLRSRRCRLSPMPRASPGGLQSSWARSPALSEGFCATC